MSEFKFAKQKEFPEQDSAFKEIAFKEIAFKEVAFASFERPFQHRRGLR